MASSQPPVITGLDNLLRFLQGPEGDAPGELGEIGALLRGGAVCGLVSNPASITGDLRDALTALRQAGVQVGAIFGPEHGTRGAAAAGEAVSSDRDAVVPSYSLYGKTVRPTPEMLSGLDVVIYDLQDVGVRFYTFTWTLSYVMEACAEAGIPVVILDRPNPIGGQVIEGPVLAPGLESFVGRYPIPTRHGMTIGELGRSFARRQVPGARVLVAGMSGWTRRAWWPETGLDWAGPSPNLPTADSCFIYPATCLLEGTNLSEGRGTPLPFRVFGAPWIHAERLAAELCRRTSSRWRAHYFTPTSSKHSGVLCGGVEWYPPPEACWQERFRPVTMGLEIIATVKELWPEEFSWRVSPSGRSHFDLLIGRPDVRGRLDAGESPAAMASSWEADEQAFLKDRAPDLIYQA